MSVSPGAQKIPFPCPSPVSGWGKSHEWKWGYNVIYQQDPGSLILGLRIFVRLSILEWCNWRGSALHRCPELQTFKFTFCFWVGHWLKLPHLVRARVIIFTPWNTTALPCILTDSWVRFYFLLKTFFQHSLSCFLIYYLCRGMGVYQQCTSSVWCRVQTY